MNLNELRNILYDFQDTPANRNELCEQLVDTNASDLVWGYAERHIPGLEEWWERQLEIQERVALHNDESSDYTFDMRALSGAYMNGAYLNVANLRGADLTGANLNNADLEEADLRGADLSSAFFFAAVLLYADLEGANLEDAIFYAASLYGANLKGADLKDANLNLADLQGANLEGANLEGAALAIAVYNDETVFPEGFDPESEGMVYEDESQ